MEQQQAPQAEADPSVPDMETARKQAVTDWPAYRAQQEAAHGSLSLEERRAKAVEDWKRLQKQKTRASDVGKRSRAADAERTEQEKGGGKDAAEDPDL